MNVSEARWLYDQLTPITPILLALSAATPIFRGYLADVDSRWDIISAVRGLPHFVLENFTNELNEVLNFDAISKLRVLR